MYVIGLSDVAFILVAPLVGYCPQKFGSESTVAAKISCRSKRKDIKMLPFICPKITRIFFVVSASLQSLQTKYTTIAPHYYLSFCSTKVFLNDAPMFQTYCIPPENDLNSESWGFFKRTSI